MSRLSHTATCARVPTANPEVALPIIEQINDADWEKQPSYRVILFNDDTHTFDEVILQIQKAVGCSIERATMLMWEAHSTGQALVYSGDIEKCEAVAGVLEQIALRVSIEQ